MKKYFIAIIAAAVTLTGCKDFLTEAPVLAQSDVLTLSTYDGLNNSTAGAYAPLGSTNWYGAHFILDNEMQTGNAKRWGVSFDKFESGRYINEYMINYTPNRTSPLWSTAYFVILSANAVIGAIDGGSVAGEEKDMNNLKAECLFLRALAHFDLLRIYAQPYNFTADASHLGVPVVTKVDSEAKPARETVAKVFKQVTTDLEDAEKLIDPAYVRSGVKDNLAVVSVDAIRALLARVYLYSNNYKGAAEYATKVIDAKAKDGSPKYTLWAAKDFEEAACYRVDVPTGGEVIFEIYNNTSQTYGGGNENVWGMTCFDGGYADCGVSNDLYELYEDDDVRKQLITPDDDGDGLFTWKYFGKGLGSIDANNVILLRLSEMYLIRAEAAVSGNLSGYSPANDLTTLATARGATPQPATPSGIALERRKELAWEGHYWFDMARTGVDMTRTDVAGSSVPTEIKAKDFRWAKPIPQREFTVNKNLEQNPKYGD